MIDKKTYFERRVTLLNEIEERKADLKQLQEDATYHAEENPKGLEKSVIKAVNKAAALEVANKYEEFQKTSTLIGKR